MRLYLARHGEAKSKLEDANRPLTLRGKKEVEKVAKYLAENKDIHLEVIMHSRKLRAKQTAEI